MDTATPQTSIAKDSMAGCSEARFFQNGTVSKMAVSFCTSITDKCGKLPVSRKTRSLDRSKGWLHGITPRILSPWHDTVRTRSSFILLATCAKSPVNVFPFSRKTFKFFRRDHELGITPLNELSCNSLTQS